MRLVKTVAAVLVFLIAALVYQTYNVIYWQNQYFNRNPFIIRFEPVTKFGTPTPPPVGKLASTSVLSQSIIHKGGVPKTFAPTENAIHK